MAERRLRYVTGCILATGLIASVNGQVVTTYSESVAERLLHSATETPDTTGLWFHIEQQQHTLANQTFARLRQEYPHWQPPQNLLDALSRLNNARQQNVSNQPEASVSQTPSSADPGEPEVMPDIFSRIAAIPSVRWSSIDSSTLTEAVRQAGQGDDADQYLLLGWIYHQRGAFETALSLFDKASRAGVPEQARTGINSAIDGLTGQALSLPDIVGLTELNQRFPQADIIAKAAAQGWYFYDNDNYQPALSLFVFAQDVQGQVLAQDKLGRTDRAAKLACETATSTSSEPVLIQYCTAALSQQQLNAYNKGQFAVSIDAAKTLQRLRELTTDEQTLLAWTYFKAGENAAAAKLFNHLLDTRPAQQDFAQALLQLSPERSQQQELAQRHPAVARLLSEQQGKVAWLRKQFDLAWYRQADQIDIYSDERFYAYTGINGRQRSGNAGEGHFDVLAGYIGLGNVSGHWRWDLHVDYEQLYSGAVNSERWFGDGIVDNTFGGITGFEDTGIRGRVQTQQPDYTVYAELGYSLIEQPVSAPITGQVGGSWFFDRATLSAMVYHQRVTDSLLSMGSTYFEDSATAWGAVTKTGLRGLYAHSVTSHRALSLSWQVDRYTGKEVKSNDHIGIRLDASQDVASVFSMPLDYFRVGPYVSWQGFSHNLSGFTRGHGGYFSPSDLTSIGIYTELLSAEARQWQVRSSVNLGYNWINQAGYRRFPLADAGPQVAAESDAGFGGDLMVEGQYLISDHWLVAGYLKQSFAVEYRATVAGIELRWFAGEHTGVTSNTLILRDPELSGLAL